MKLEEFANIKQGVVLEGFMPYLEMEVEKMVKGLENKTFSAINAGTLTPEVALSAWMERYALKRLLTSFEQRINVGQTVASLNARNLDIP